MKNEEMFRNEINEKQKKIAVMESNLEESERTNAMFIENLNRDNQTLQETLKNSEFLLN